MNKKEKIKGPVLTIAVYKPKRGKAAQLQKVVESHWPLLRKLKLVTARKTFIGRAADGSFIEIFEWASTEATAAAHRHPAVMEVWGAMMKLGTLPAPASLKECKQPFPNFEVVK